MNAHDSERIKGLLEELGLGEAPTAEDADVVVFNTCTIREKPDTKLAAYLGEAAARKRRDPDRVIAVGGCYAEAQRERIFELYPDVDVAFGPGLDRAPRRVARRRRHRRRARPLRPRRPRVRGRRCRSTASGRSRRGCRCRWAATRSARTASSRPSAAASRAAGPGDDPRRGDAARRATASGSSRSSARTSTRGAATSRRTSAPSSASCCAPATPSTGIERIRFTSPHPKDFREPVIAAIAECDAVCEHVAPAAPVGLVARS